MIFHSLHFATHLAESAGQRSHTGGRPNLPEHSDPYCLLNKLSCCSHVSPWGSLAFVWAREEAANRTEAKIATKMRIMASYPHSSPNCRAIAFLRQSGEISPPD